LSVQVALLGLIVGTFVGLSGVGAGVLMAPTLILLGIHPTIAVGTDLAYSAVTKLVGTVRNAGLQLINRVWFGWMLAGSIPGTVAGTQLTRLIPASLVDHVLQQALAAVLILASLAIVAREVLAHRLAGSGPARGDLARRRPLVVVAVGAVIGFLVGLTSIGSGSLFMLFLLLCSSMTPREAVATDIANAAGLTLVAALLHLANGTVNLPLAGNLLLGSVPGILLGSRLAQHVPTKPLKMGIAVLVMASGLKMML
jgi:uncharacterized membrane protein YfcA